MRKNVLSNLIITKVTAVSSLFSPAKAKGKMENRLCWTIIFKHEGESFYTFNDKHLQSDINHIMILPKGSSYFWECTKTGVFSFIEFECEQTYPEPISLPIKHGEKILKRFNNLEYKWNLKGELYGIESIRDTYSIILDVLSESLEKYTPNDKRKKIQPAIEYISQNFNERITNDILASKVGMSTVYFRKTFTEVMGVSPIFYAKQLRIEKAKELLKSDYGTLSDIALSLGYSNLYDFSRDFKVHTGKAPSKY